MRAKFENSKPIDAQAISKHIIKILKIYFTL
jgi:hypothetical protein